MEAGAARNIFAKGDLIIISFKITGPILTILSLNDPVKKIC
jgi:hypothetical protein